MMSSNLPLLLWDVSEWYDYNLPSPYQKYPNPSLAHYFSDECGEKFYDKDNFEEILIKFMKTSYSPKEYVKKELSYDASVKKLISIFEE